MRSVGKVRPIKRKVALYILGQHEIFGLDEIIDNTNFRKTSVVCESTKAMAFFITEENFIDCVNTFRFSDKILNEQIMKHQHYNDRLEETISFMNMFDAT